MDINIKDLQSVLEKIITQALLEDVSEGVIETGKEKVDEVVYNAYDSQYDRTGLLRESFESEMLDGNTLQVTNTRQDGDRDIVEVIEYGKGYYSNELDERIGARPFMESTAEELRNGKARELLIKGLSRKLGAGNVF